MLNGISAHKTVKHDESDISQNANMGKSNFDHMLPLEYSETNSNHSNSMEEREINANAVNGYEVKAKVKRPNVSAFLSKTFDIFSNPEFQAEGICGWSPKGDSVIIHSLRDFSDKVLPQYFKHGNFQSFVRQLNMYNFRKTVADPTHGEFKHPLFKRGMREALDKIKRKPPSNGNKTSSTPSRTTYQNYHQMIDSIALNAELTDTGQEPVQVSIPELDTGQGFSDRPYLFEHSTLGCAPTVKCEEGPVEYNSDYIDESNWNDKTLELKQQSEKMLIKLQKLEERQRITEEKLKEVDEENKLVKQENALLWRRMRAQASGQKQMQSKMHRLLYCMYEMYMASGGHGHSQSGSNLLSDPSTTISEAIGEMENRLQFGDTPNSDSKFPWPNLGGSQNRDESGPRAQNIPFGIRQWGAELDLSGLNSNVQILGLDSSPTFARQNSFTDVFLTPASNANPSAQNNHSLLLENGSFQDSIGGLNDDDFIHSGSNRDPFDGLPIERITSIDWATNTYSYSDDSVDEILEIRRPKRARTETLFTKYCEENDERSGLKDEESINDAEKVLEYNSSNPITKIDSLGYQILSEMVKISSNDELLHFDSTDPIPLNDTDFEVQQHLHAPENL